MRRRRAGARQRAHYELTTFRYRPRRAEAHREATVPPSRAASAGALRQFRAASAPPVARGLALWVSDASQRPAAYNCPIRCPAPSAYPVMIAS